MTKSIGRLLQNFTFSKAILPSLLFLRFISTEERSSLLHLDVLSSPRRRKFFATHKLGRALM